MDAATIREAAFNRGVPARDECVLRDVFEKRCRDTPDAPFIRVHEGALLTYADFQETVLRTAAGLARLGVRQGDTVLVWLPNGIDCLRCWFGINWLGAVYVPINTGYVGNLLAHVIGVSRATLMVVHPDLAPRLREIDTGVLRVVEATALSGEPHEVPPLERPIEPWDTQSIIFTSGTTGASKGVLSSYAHLYAMSGAASFPMLTREDRYLCNLPLFHVGGTIAVAAMLARGGSISLVAQFSTSNFWGSVRETQTTFVLLLGAMASFIESQPPCEGDRDHSLRNVVIIPLLAGARGFGRRFGVDVYTFFNMSEISVPIVSGPNPDKPGVCGRPRAGVQLRLVDENDCEVAPGSVGQLLIRTDVPWALTSGYFGEPDATAAVWRNGWFHTGDAFRVDAEGDYLFVDRLKDSVRRRGENISSSEVEREVLAHPAVAEAAVVPVPATASEDEILCVIVTRPDAVLDPVDLLLFLEPRLAHFMLPRYVRFAGALPKTPTQKVEKYLLRATGLTPDTWDREAAGIRARRKRLGNPR